MTIGEKIKARRKELGLTTEELGRMIGVQRSAITKYEKNRVDLKSRQINQIAEALQINPLFCFLMKILRIILMMIILLLCIIHYLLPVKTTYSSSSVLPR